MSSASDTVSERGQPRRGLPHRIGWRRLGISYQVIEPAVAVADTALIIGSSVIGGASYQLFMGHAVGELQRYVACGLIASIAYALAAYRSELYQLQGMLQRRRDYPWVAGSWLWAVLVVSVVLFLLKRGADISRGSVVGFSMLGSIGLLAWRATFKSWLRSAIDRGAIHGRRIVMLGTHEELAAVSEGELMSLCGLDEAGRVSLPTSNGANGRLEQRVAVTATLDLARKTSAKEIILALPWGKKAQLEFVRSRLRLTPLPVRLLPDRSVQSVLNYRTWRTQQVLLIEIQRAPLSASEQLIKRILDIFLAAFALVGLLPLMLLVGCAIRLGSPGPAIFRQRRRGFNGREFTIYKFRTMTVMEDGQKIIQASRSDSRITRLGRLLRQTSIDELPQLYNVLRGDMSLVGPRPHAVAHDNEYSQLIANYAFRHHVKPGITGWAQINGLRGETPRLEQMADRVELDLWYINNWSLALDLQILLRTSFDLVFERSAY